MRSGAYTRTCVEDICIIRDEFMLVFRPGTLSQPAVSAAAGDIAESKNDIASIKRDTATKDLVFALQTQVNAIKTDIRDMKHTKLHARVADLEEKVFGAARD